jgi:hypothetical protein
MHREQQNFEDIVFILNEMKRFAAMPPEQGIDHLRQNPDDIVAMLHAPGGRGDLLCGAEAYGRFARIAGRVLERSREAKNFDRAEYAAALRKAFCEMFIDKEGPVSQSSVTRLLSRAAGLAREGFVSLTYHLPCILFTEKEPSEFAVGPVSFMRSERFLHDREKAFDDYHRLNSKKFAEGYRMRHQEASDEEISSKGRELADEELKRIRKYYGDYGWVASVAIPPCHPEVSKDRAQKTVDAALDVLRLFVASVPEWYRRANGVGLPAVTRILMTDEKGCIQPFTAWTGQGAPAGKGWFEGIMKRAPQLWRQFGEAIAVLPVGADRDELTQRLLDALHWFGQAVVEQNRSATVVKYAAALERLTITGHVERGLEALVIERVGFLNRDRTEKPYKEIMGEVGELYQCRSDLMHGSISPYSPKIRGVLRAGWEITRWSLFKAAQLFAELRTCRRANGRELSRYYDGWAAQVKKTSP